MAPPPLSIERDVSATRAEFERGVRSAFPQSLSITETGYRVWNSLATLEIDIADLPPLRIALLCLPRLHVRLRFTAGNDDQCRALLAHLDSHLHRGGG